MCLPARNQKDLEEIPAEAREKLELVWLEDVEQALRHTLDIELPASPGDEHRSGSASRLSARPERDG